MNNLPMNSGTSIPQLGFGLWQVADAAKITEMALSLGYRLIDGAAVYGNEVGMGQGIRNSGIMRDALFVTTKVWNDRQGFDNARRAVEESLERLALDRLDLCLIHWPCSGKNLYVETWRALIAMRDEGVITSIGVSNFNIAQIDRLAVETAVTPAINQIELHPRLQQADLRAALAARGIITQSWTPLGQGLSFDAAPIQAIAVRTGKSPAQVILRWHVQLGLSVIPRSTRVEGLAQNLDVFDFSLTSDEMAAIASLNLNQRTGPDPDHFG